jgi:hypothetical protein
MMLLLREVTDTHFTQAVAEPQTKAAQNQAQSVAVTSGTAEESLALENENRPGLPSDSVTCGSLHVGAVTPAGFEPASPP